MKTFHIDAFRGIDSNGVFLGSSESQLAEKVLFFDSIGMTSVGATGSVQSEFRARVHEISLLSLIVAEPTEVVIDIKPDDATNAVNLGSKGVIPVAILTTDDFDATTVDPDTVELAGSAVAVRGKAARTMASIEDVDGDGDLDLILHVETENLDLETGATKMTLTGETFDGTAIVGSDVILIVAD